MYSYTGYGSRFSQSTGLGEKRQRLREELGGSVRVESAGGADSEQDAVKEGLQPSFRFAVREGYHYDTPGS
jgi:hypothetical protein